MNLLGPDVIEELRIMVDREGRMALQYHGAIDAMTVTRIASALERGAQMMRAQHNIQVPPV